MDSETILGPKWTPRGVLESGDHVESDFDLPRTWPWPLKSTDLPQPGTSFACKEENRAISVISRSFLAFFVSLALRILRPIWLWPLRGDWLRSRSLMAARLSKTDLGISRPFLAQFSNFLRPCHPEFRGQSESDLCTKIFWGRRHSDRLRKTRISAWKKAWRILLEGSR